MLIENVDQSSPEWLSLKAGVPSSSNFSKIVTSKGLPSKTRKSYMYQLAGEIITGIREEGYQNASMLRGLEMESEAVNLFELVTDVKTKKVGIVYQNEKKMYLCSPDRLIIDPDGIPLGLLEIKCPEVQTHVGYLLDNKLPTAYFQQVQGQMFVAGLPYCEFMSYYPGLNPLNIKVDRDEEFIEKLDKELQLFCSELQDVVKRIK